MTDYERDLAAGGKPLTDYERDLAAGGQPLDAGAGTPVPPKPQEGRIDKLLGAFGNAIHGVGAGLSSAADFASHPLESLQNPSMRREFERGLDTMLTFGSGQKLAQHIDESRIGQWINQHFGGPQGALGHAQEVEDQAGAPGARQAGELLAGVAPQRLAGAGGAAMGLGHRVASGITSRLPAVGGKLAGAGMGAATGLLGTAVGSAAMSAGQAGEAGENPLTAMRDAALDPVSLTVGAVGGGMAGAARGEAAAIRDPRKQLGKDIKAIEDAHGHLNMTGEPVSGGKFDQGPLVTAEPGQAGSYKLNQGLVDEAKLRDTEALAQARAEYGDAQTRAIAKAEGARIGGRTHVRADEAHYMLEALDKKNHYSDGNVVDKTLQNQVDEIRMALMKVHPRVALEESRLAAPQESHVPPTQETQVLPEARTLPSEPAARGPQPEHVATTWVEPLDLIKAKNNFNDRAQWGQPATQENRPYRLIIGSLTNDIERMSPEFKAINAKYGNTMEGLKEAHDALFGQNRAEVSDRAGTDRRAVNKLERLGDDSRAALSEEQQMGKLGEDPRYADLIETARLKKAQERLRYGSHTSTSMAGEGERLGRRLLGQGMGHAAGAALGSLAGPAGTAAGAAIGGAAGHAIGANARQLRARVVLPLAEKAGTATGTKAGIVTHQFTQWKPEQLAAIRDAQRQQNELRAQLAGGQ